jgi:hypothetical protein
MQRSPADPEQMIPLTFPRAIGTTLARFASKEDLSDWLTQHPTYRSAARLIRPKTTPGEHFALLVEYPDAATRERAALEDELHELRALKLYQENNRKRVRELEDVI